jgi:hypothetical protein
VFGKRVLRRILGPRRGEVTEGWRELHNEKLHNFYSHKIIHQSDEIKEDEMSGV